MTIVLVSRYRLRNIFKDREQIEQTPLKWRYTRSDDQARCDICGQPLLTHQVMLVIQNGKEWGVVCHECKRKHYLFSPILSWSEYEEMKRCLL